MADAGITVLQLRHDGNVVGIQVHTVGCGLYKRRHEANAQHRSRPALLPTRRMCKRHDVEITRGHVPALDESIATTGRDDGRAEVHPHSVVRFWRHLRETT